MNRIVIPIQGMHCKSCELSIEDNIKKIESVDRVTVSHIHGQAKIWYEKQKPTQSELRSAVEKAGYTIGNPITTQSGWISHNPNTYLFLGCAMAILAFGYVLLKNMGLNYVIPNLSDQSIFTPLMIGLVAGVSSCMALIGGIVLAISARHTETHPGATRMQNFRPHLFFNLGRFLGFAFFGGVIGLIGGALQPSARLLAILAIIVGAVMVLLGLKLIEVFPILDRVNLTLPKFVSRLLGFRTDVKEYSHKGSFFAGAMSFFLPCGFTQAMQLYAISTGSFVAGAFIMALFAVGTSVGLIGIGGLTSIFSRKAKLFFVTAGLAVIVLGIFNISNASRIAFPRSNTASSNTSVNYEVQTITTQFWARPLPDLAQTEYKVKVNQPVKFIIEPQDDGIGCMSTILIPGLHNQPEQLKKGRNVILTFLPNQTGEYPITCAMGVVRATLKVE